jgi:hypothetical protein
MLKHDGVGKAAFRIFSRKSRRAQNDPVRVGTNENRLGFVACDPKLSMNLIAPK